MNEWGKWFRDNSDKYLLVILILAVLGITLHVMHDKPSDDGEVQFINGLTDTLVGAFIGLITGAVLRKTSAASTETKDPETGRTVQIAAAKEEEK